MIVLCKNCNKKFNISDSLIPKEGRLVQCGSCDSKWHQSQAKDNMLKIDPSLILNEDEKIKNIKEEEKKEHLIPSSSEENFIEPKKDKGEKLKNQDVKKKIGFLSMLFISIITIIALIIFIDTFQYQLRFLFPNLEIYLDYLYENLINIFLLIKDLFKSY